MKKLSILTAPAIALGVGILCAPQALAAGYTLNQTNVDAAVAAAGRNTEGIFCDDSGGQFCTLNEGDWTQEGDVEMPVIDDSVTPAMRWGLVLQNDVNISNPDGGTFTGNIAISADEATLNNLDVTGDVTIQNADAEVTINGGSYTVPDGSWSGALNVDNAKTVTINNADFAAGGASAVYVSGGDITINGGSFTSEGDKGIELFGFNSLNITGGTFTGGAAGLAFEHIPDGSTVSLSGGTFTGTGANGKAILSGNTDDTSTITNMLASGYHFTNSTIATEDGLGGGAYIAGTTSVVSDSASEEETAGEEAKTTEADTTAETTSGVGSPNTGAYTAEEGSANSSSILVIMTTVLMTLAGAVLVKKHSKRA